MSAFTTLPAHASNRLRVLAPSPSRRLSLLFILGLLFQPTILCQTTALGTPSSNPRDCVTSECHNSFTGRFLVHEPIKHGVCEMCHREADSGEHSFRLASQGADLCLRCHWDLGTGPVVHAPFSTGRCTSCHDPHASENPFLLRSENTANLCSGCHQDTFRGMPSLHAPVAAGECSLCHAPHYSDNEHLLTAPEDQLCFLCHDGMADELRRIGRVHAPVKSGCIGCHDPHGGASAGILTVEPPGLCYACHESVHSEVSSASCKHDVVEVDGSCLNCHTPHASSIEPALKSDQRSLCLGCHDRSIELDSGKILANVAAEIEKTTYPHGPVAQRDCSGCHQSHGGDHFRLLRDAYPEEFYAPFDLASYGLCFQCHPERNVLVKETDFLTDFRNGRLNLHYVHVNDPEKGRTCRACHATHGSNRPKHMRESVAFGSWDIPLDFTKTATGGSCKTGCHKLRSYDRITPVIYAGDRPESRASGSADERSRP